MPQIQLNAGDAQAWLQWVTNFDRTYGMFQQTLTRLRNSQTYVLTRRPELANQFSIQMNSGTRLAQQMASLKQTRDQVAAWLNSIGQTIRQVSRGTMDWLRTTFGLGEIDEQLGLAPVYIAISLAVAAAALVAVARWITETEQLNTRIEAARRLEARGIAPADAARIVAQTAGDNVPLVNANGVLGIPWNYVAIGGVALLVLPMLMRRA